MLKKSSNNAANSKPIESVDTLIGVKTQIQGDLEFSGGLRIDGKLTGNLKSVDGANSTLVLSETAHVEGNINVAHVIINGRVNGNIIASERVILQPKAVIKGDVRYRTVEMALGASVNGALVCEEAGPKQVNSPTQSVKPAQPK
jgi:cytoskeletal protein CcmA (bactofilin family)